MDAPVQVVSVVFRICMVNWQFHDEGVEDDWADSIRTSSVLSRQRWLIPPSTLRHRCGAAARTYGSGERIALRLKAVGKSEYRHLSAFISRHLEVVGTKV